MFPTREGKQAGDKVFITTRSFVEGRRRRMSQDKALLKAFWEACSEYYSNRLYFSVGIAQINIELKAIYEDVTALHRSIKEISPQAIHSIERELQYLKSSRDMRGWVREILPTLKLLKTACENPLKLKGKKQKDLALLECCNRLWEIREGITGNAFVRTFDLAPGTGRDEFTSRDALFVQVAMSAIDPSVQVKTIKSELQAISKAVSSQKKP